MVGNAYAPHKLTVVTIEWLVQSIGDITESGKLSKEWIGLILLPLLSGNTAGMEDVHALIRGRILTKERIERLRSVNISVRDELNLCIKTAIGSTIVS